jgi:hypothetical protein
VAQELLRYGSAKVTMDVYTQAQMPAKRKAQQKVVEMVRPEVRRNIEILGPHLFPVGTREFGVGIC